MLTSHVEHTPAANRRACVRDLLRSAVAAAVGGAAVVEAYAEIIRLSGVTMRAGFLGASHAEPLTAGGFATGVVVCSFWGTVVAFVLARRSRRPRGMFVAFTTVLVAVSLVVPLGAGSTDAATKLALAGAHLLVAAVVIPIIAHALPRRTQGAA